MKVGLIPANIKTVVVQAMVWCSGIRQANIRIGQPKMVTAMTVFMGNWSSYCIPCNLVKGNGLRIGTILVFTFHAIVS